MTSTSSSENENNEAAQEDAPEGNAWRLVINNPMRNFTKGPVTDALATKHEPCILMSSYLQSLCELPNCFDRKSKKFTGCNCISSFTSFLPAADMLIDFSKKEKGFIKPSSRNI